MQRLTSRTRRRLAGEDGASAVLVSLLLVPMLGFAAIAVDVGAMYAEKAKLQTAADAAAYAIARDCATGNCGDTLATAQSLVAANLDGATAAPPVLDNDPFTVTVTDSIPKEHWFAPVLGHDSTTVSATATATWEAPSSGTAQLPLTFSWCEWSAQTGGGLPSGTTSRTILFPKTSDTGCTGPSHKFVPGGFGWLDTDGHTCEAASTVGGRSMSESGNNPSKGCSPEDFAALRNQTVLLPIFDESGGEGSHAWYRVYGYAAFTITGYYFAGKYSWQKPCSGNERCIRGYFTRFVEASQRFSCHSKAPQLGASIVRLIR
jgi:Flp pilus assembly protein TadG